MLDYLYDGSFEGFLTCVYAHYYQEKAAGIYLASRYQLGLLHQAMQLETDEEQAETVAKAIREKIGDQAWKRVYCVFLSSEDDKEMTALRYIRLGFQMGSAAALMHGNAIVFAAQQIEHKVRSEVHRLSGLLRFSVLAFHEREILYAPLTPDHDVIELLAPHFTDRYKNDPFIIHDTRRKKALFSQSGGWYIAPLSPEELPDPTVEEAQYRALWKRYFDTIAIKERINPRCQKNFMPVRYWNHLTEMKSCDFRETFTSEVNDM